MNIEQIAQEVQDSFEVNGFAYVSNREAVEFLRRCLSKLAEQVGEPVAWMCWMDGDTEMNPSDAAITRYEPTTYKNRAKLYTEAQLIAASQAREMQLREAINDYFNQYPGMMKGYILDALAVPTDDTSALEALIAKVGEVMRERCANGCDKEATDVHNAPAAIVARRCGETIRALPSVTLEDLQK